MILAKKGAKFPVKGTFFVIAANGAFVRKDLGLFEGLVSMPLKDVPGAVKVGYAVQTIEGPAYVQKGDAVTTGFQQNNWWNKDNDDTLQIVDTNTGKLMGDTTETLDQRLLAVEPYINMNLPKLPQEVIYNALLFFRKVFNKHHAEAIVLLAYNEARKEYKLFCPKQKVSGGHIDYDRDLSERLTTIRDNEDTDWLTLLEDGYTKVGTIHSHCDFQAFHSGTDTGDEASFNGVHITLGHVVSQAFSVASSLALNDYREEVDVENVALGIRREGDRKAAESAYISSGRQNFYQIDIEDSQKQVLKDQFETDIDANWMNKVTPSFQQWQGGIGYQGGYQGGVSGGGYSQGSGYSTSYGNSYDNPSDIPGGVSYILVNGQWVEEKKSDSATAEIEKSEDEVLFTETEYAEEKGEPVTDIPNYDEWLKDEMKNEGGQG